MKEYLDLLQEILDNGREKESGRANMPNTIGISHGLIKMDLKDGFPLLTTKKMYWKGIVIELLWFLRGETNIKYLVDNNVNIWNGDAYRWYLKYDKEFNNQSTPPLTMEQFIDTIKTSNVTKPFFHNSEYVLGDLGKVYGYQWRNQNGVDQIKDVVEGLKKNPYSRYHIIDGWNKADFPEMALPPCHLLYQFIVRPLSFEERKNIMNNLGIYVKDGFEYTEEDFDKYNIPKFYLDLNMYQRSVDTPLGCPFNIASMALLLTIMAKVSNMVVGVANWIGGDTHIYVNQIDGVKEQLSREPLPLPKLIINKDISSLEDICNLELNDFVLENYKSHDKINFTLSVGL